MCPVCTYQVPVDWVGLAWQVGEEVEIPGTSERRKQLNELGRQIREARDRGEEPDPEAWKQVAALQKELMRPPLQVPDEFGPAQELLLDLGLLAPLEGLYFVHRWTATALMRRYSERVHNPSVALSVSHQAAAWRVSR